jgi:hypothetical protein
MPGNQTLAELAPNNVHFAGIDAARQKAILVELCGLPANYRFRLAGKTHNGALQPFGIAEIDIS